MPSTSHKEQALEHARVARELADQSPAEGGEYSLINVIARSTTALVHALLEIAHEIRVNS